MNGNMRRGVILEPVLRALYLEGTGGDATWCVRSYADSPHRTWLIGTPEDFVRVNGRLRLVGYKCPYLSPSRNPEKILFRYVVQLNHYCLIEEDLGILTDELALVELDLEICQIGDLFWNRLLAGRVVEDEREGESIRLTNLSQNLLLEILTLSRQP